MIVIPYLDYQRFLLLFWEKPTFGIYIYRLLLASMVFPDWVVLVGLL